MVHRLSSRIGLKKEHLALDEVATILRRINTEKREADRQGGRRELFQIDLLHGAAPAVLLIEDQLHVIKGLLLPAPSQPPNRPPLPEGRLGPLPPEMLIPGGKCARVEIATLVALATIDVVLPSLLSLANGA
jgi:hypothetical protein